MKELLIEMSKQASSNQVSPQPYQPPPPPQKPPQHFAQIQVYNIPATSNPRHPTAQTVKQKEGWWRRNQKNKPQSNSAGSGMNLFAKVVFKNFFKKQTYIQTYH